MSLRALFRTVFPAVVTVASPITLVKAGVRYTFGFDTDALLAVLTPMFVQVKTQQIKTTAGDVTVATTNGSIIINKTVGQATNVTFPLAGQMVSDDCLVVDFKGDSGTNNITLTPTAPETIMGQSTYVIASNGASLRLTPVPGVGYAL